VQNEKLGVRGMRGKAPETARGRDRLKGVGEAGRARNEPRGVPTNLSNIRSESLDSGRRESQSPQTVEEYHASLQPEKCRGCECSYPDFNDDGSVTWQCETDPECYRDEQSNGERDPFAELSMDVQRVRAGLMEHLDFNKKWGSIIRKRWEMAAQFETLQRCLRTNFDAEHLLLWFNAVNKGNQEKRRRLESLEKRYGDGVHSLEWCLERLIEDREKIHHLCRAQREKQNQERLDLERRLEAVKKLIPELDLLLEVGVIRDYAHQFGELLRNVVEWRDRLHVVIYKNAVEGCEGSAEEATESTSQVKAKAQAIYDRWIRTRDELIEREIRYAEAQDDKALKETRDTLSALYKAFKDELLLLALIDYFGIVETYPQGYRRRLEYPKCKREAWKEESP